MIILSVAGLAALSAALMTVTLGSSREQSAESLQSQADYICQAGLSQAMYQMQRGLDPTVGSSHNQHQLCYHHTKCFQYSLRCYY